MASQTHTPQSLRIDGVASAAGGVYQSATINGVGKIQGKLSCEHFSIDGVATVQGAVNAEQVDVHGVLKIADSLKTLSLLLEGMLSVKENCSSEKFHGKGAFRVEGLLNVESLDVDLEGKCNVSEIGGQSIAVRSKPGLFSRKKELVVDTIEGEDISLESTRASVVRGNRVKIGPGCTIDRIEYQTSLDVHKSAKVRESRKQS